MTRSARATKTHFASVYELSRTLILVQPVPFIIWIMTKVLLLRLSSGTPELKFGTVIPEGMTITLYRWREKDGGADFHARYLLTDRGGMRIDAGFSAEGRHQTTDIALMNFELSQQKRNSLDRDADVFELGRAGAPNWPKRICSACLSKTGELAWTIGQSGFF